jgi:hypothetical protein
MIVMQTRNYLKYLDPVSVLIIGVLISITVSVLLYLTGADSVLSLIISFFGIIITLYVDLILRFEKIPLRDVDSILSRAESDLAEYRKSFYYYYRSHEQGQSYWRYLELDFGKDPRQGYLYASFKIAPPRANEEQAPKDLTYDVYAYLIEGQLCMFHVCNSSIRQAISIVALPCFVEQLGLDQPVFGVDSHLDWDKKWTCDPAILSEKILHKNNTRVRGLLGSEDANIVANLWNTNNSYLVRDFAVDQHHDPNTNS